MYRALSAYYVGKYDYVSRWVNLMINQLSWKQHSLSLLEARLMLSIIYYLKGDYGLLKQISGSIQRQIRSIGKENCVIGYTLQQMIKIAISPHRKNKYFKIKELVAEINNLEANYFSPIKLIRLDDNFIRKFRS